MGGTLQPGYLTDLNHTDKLMVLMLSLELGSRCQAMVGNFDSNISDLLYSYICYYQGKCPKVFSFGPPLWRNLAG